MIVTTSTFTLQLILSAGTADVDVSYVDRTATAYPIGATEQTAATATTQTICSAPAASTSREIDFLSVKIKTTGGVVTIQKLNSSGAVVTQLISVTLLDEESLVYTHGSGWCAMDANGNRKEATASNFGAITVTNLTDSALTSGRVVLAGTGGLLVDSSAITYTAGKLGLSAGLTLFGSASNIAVGSNHISSDGTDTGLSFDGANNGVFSANMTASGLITSTANGEGLALTPVTGTSAAYHRAQNSGGAFYIGLDSSTASAFGTAGNYGTVIFRPASTGFAISRGASVDLFISSSGVATFSSLAGVGTRTVVADSNGVLSAP
jgi:hypothetical protein